MARRRTGRGDGAVALTEAVWRFARRLRGLRRFFGILILSRNLAALLGRGCNQSPGPGAFNYLTIQPGTAWSGPVWSGLVRFGPVLTSVLVLSVGCRGCHPLRNGDRSRQDAACAAAKTLFFAQPLAKVRFEAQSRIGKSCLRHDVHGAAGGPKASRGRFTAPASGKRAGATGWCWWWKTGNCRRLDWWPRW